MYQAVEIYIVIIQYISLLTFKVPGMEDLHFDYPANIATNIEKAWHSFRVYILFTRHNPHW